METDNGRSQVPDAQDVMSGLGSVDSDFGLFDDDQTEKLQEEKEKMAEEHRELVRAYADVFSSPQGQKVIEDLLDRTLRESVFMPERENPNILGHIREGQNSIIRYISKRIVQGKNVKNLSPEGES